MHSIDECYSIYEGQHLTISTSVTSPKVVNHSGGKSVKCLKSVNSL